MFAPEELRCGSPLCPCFPPPSPRTDGTRRVPCPRTDWTRRVPCPRTNRTRVSPNAPPFSPPPESTGAGRSSNAEGLGTRRALLRSSLTPQLTAQVLLRRRRAPRRPRRTLSRHLARHLRGGRRPARASAPPCTGLCARCGECAATGGGFYFLYPPPSAESLRGQALRGMQLVLNLRAVGAENRRP